MSYDEWKGAAPEGEEWEPSDGCPICGKRDSKGEPCSTGCAEAFIRAEGREDDRDEAAREARGEAFDRWAFGRSA